MQPVPRLAGEVAGDLGEQARFEEFLHQAFTVAEVGQDADRPRGDVDRAEEPEPPERHRGRWREPGVAQRKARPDLQVADTQLVEPAVFVGEPLGHGGKTGRRPGGEPGAHDAQRQRKSATRLDDGPRGATLVGHPLGVDQSGQQVEGVVLAERNDLEHRPAGYAGEQPPSGHQYRTARCARQQREHLPGADGVVEDEQHHPVGETRPEGRRQRVHPLRQHVTPDAAAGEQFTENRGRVPGHTAWIGEPDEQLAVGKPRPEPVGDPDRQSALPSTRGTGERHDRHCRLGGVRGQPADHLVDELGAADEVGDVRRELAECLPRRRERPARDAGRLGRVQRRILGQDPLVQLTDLHAGLQAHLVDEQRAQPGVGVEGVGLAVRAVEGQHQLVPEAFAEAVFGRERGELAHQLGVPAEGQLGVDPSLERVQALFFQPGCDVALE